jgi:hypothetical protein
MDPDRGEKDHKTDENCRRQAEKILGNRHEEIQIGVSGQRGYFIQDIKEQNDR